MVDARRPPERVSLAGLAWTTLFVATFGALAVRNFVLGLPEVPAITLGPATVSPFGVLVVLGFLFGYSLVRRWCMRFELDWKTLSWGMVWIAGLGFVLSHAAAVLLYPSERPLRNFSLSDVSSHISSFGGFYGGALVALAYLKLAGLSARPYCDGLAFGLLGGFLFGRLGCFAVHDHPGLETGFVLAVDVQGVRRHDLGLYELLFLAVLFAVLGLWTRKRRPADGSVVGVIAVAYAPARFLLDFLRVTDVTYGGLTPGQWLCFPTLAIGVFLLLTPRPPRAAAAHS